MVPRKVGTDWEVLAPAKLNLYLQVLGKRSDGFHDLETLMVPVQLFDHLRWSPSNSGNPCAEADVHVSQSSLSIDSRPFNLSQEQRGSLDSGENLVLRAAQLLAARSNLRPYGHFHLTKRIPLQAGLGGGSSDAAATLRLANACWNAGLSDSDLTELASELGSDVPFFLNAGPGVCRGRGERVTILPGLPKLHFVLVKPSMGLSTAQVFKELAASAEPDLVADISPADRLTRLTSALRAGSIGTACRWMTNRLEECAAKMAPVILRIKELLAEKGCWGQMMTGSGSTVFGIARTARHARLVARQIMAQEVGTVFITSSGW